VAKRAVESLRSPDYASLVQVLTEARESSGIRHDELAKRLGKGRTYIYSVEHFGRRVDPLEVVEISRALGLAPGELLTRWLARLSDQPGS